MLKHMPEAVFIPHPYIPVGKTDPLNFKDWAHRPLNAISVSRLDFDKNSHWLFEANRKLPEDRQIEIRGSENRMYTKNKIVNVYPEYKQDSHRPKDDRATFKLEFHGAVNLCKTAKYMTDFSLIKGDGGGTQYTFLEAMDAGTICLIHRDWIREKDSMIDEGPDQNCISFASPRGLSSFLAGTITEQIATHIRANALKILIEHDAVRVAAKIYCEVEMKQQPPFCIQIELTEGCNLACSFCGIAGIRDNKANGPDKIRGKKFKSI